MNTRVVLGVDIGGTKVAAGLVDEAGQILSKTRVPMVVTGSATDAMDCVHRAIEAAMKMSSEPIQAIGISSPGPLDPKAGIILNTPNLPCWRNFALLKEVTQRYGLRTQIENDANAAGLAEALWGAGENARTVFYATIGTGIGTAIIENRRIYHGRTGAAAEGGHMTLDFKAPVRCACGKRGCLESMASGPAIARRAQERLANDGSLGLLSTRSAQGHLTAKDVFEAAEAGDPLAKEIVEEAVGLLAVWLGNVIDLLEPEVIVMGGGVGSRMSPWLPKLQSSLLHWTINTRAGEIPLLPARYGEDSGIAGSAALWLSCLTTIDGC